MSNIGVARSTFYFETHGEINTQKTIDLAKQRADELGIRKIIVASETGLSALKALRVFIDHQVIVVSSAVRTKIKGSIIGDLKIGISDKEILEKLKQMGAELVRGTDPFWGLGAHAEIMDTGKIGMMFFRVICSGLHVCMTAVLEATDSGHLEQGEEVVSLSGSFVGLETLSTGMGLQVHLGFGADDYCISKQEHSGPFILSGSHKMTH